MDEEELGEETVLLDSPLDKLEPYGLFKSTLLGIGPNSTSASRTRLNKI